MTKMTVVKNEPSLDERIASALSDDGLSFEYLRDLYLELDRAVGDHEEKARQARARSIDPTNLHGGSARSEAEDHEFYAMRLRNAATPLGEVCQKARAREAEARWNSEANQVELEAAQTADILLETYSKTTDFLISVFKIMAAIDHKIDYVNATAPSGIHRRLCGVEAVARNVPAITNRNPSWGRSNCQNCRLVALALHL